MGSFRWAIFHFYSAGFFLFCCIDSVENAKNMELSDKKGLLRNESFCSSPFMIGINETKSPV